MTNDRYLQNLAYCRLKNLTFGYTLPSSLTSKIRVEKIRVYFSGDNLFTWTKLKSDYLDPEQMTSDANGRVYPFSRTFSFGVDISFSINQNYEKDTLYLMHCRGIRFVQSR